MMTHMWQVCWESRVKLTSRSTVDFSTAVTLSYCYEPTPWANARSQRVSPAVCGERREQCGLTCFCLQCLLTQGKQTQVFKTFEFFSQLHPRSHLNGNEFNKTVFLSGGTLFMIEPSPLPTVQHPTLSCGELSHSRSSVSAPARRQSSALFLEENVSMSYEGTEPFGSYLDSLCMGGGIDVCLRCVCSHCSLASGSYSPFTKSLLQISYQIFNSPFAKSLRNIKLVIKLNHWICLPKLFSLGC